MKQLHQMILKTIIPQDMTQKEIKYVIDAMVISDGAEYIQVSLVNGRDYLLETSRKRDYIKELNVEHEIPG